MTGISRNLMLVKHIKGLLEIRLQTERSGVRIPVGKEIFSSPKRPDRIWGPPSLLKNGNPVFFLGNKVAGA
jgi:hypothetical protein